MLETVTSYAWVFWLGLILIFAIVEMTTGEFTFLMLAIGSLGGLLAGLLGVPWWGQILIAGILSLLLLLAVRPALLKVLKRGADPARSNLDAVIGMTGVVTTDFTGNASHVKLANGETWTARFVGASTPAEGDDITVVTIDGATAVVAPTERNAS